MKKYVWLMATLEGYKAGFVEKTEAIDEDCMNRPSLLSNQNAWRERLRFMAKDIGDDWEDVDILWSQIDGIIILDAQESRNHHFYERTAEYIFGGESFEVSKKTILGELRGLLKAKKEYVSLSKAGCSEKETKERKKI